MISAVTSRGMIIDGAFNSDRFIDFMKRLIKGADHKGFLVLDSLRVHHGKPVKKWVEESQHEIELFLLPGYSPELNPDERLNADLKHKIATAAPVRTRKKLLEVTASHMRLIEQSAQQVINYFGGPNIRDAASQ